MFENTKQKEKDVTVTGSAYGEVHLFFSFCYSPALVQGCIRFSKMGLDSKVGGSVLVARPHKLVLKTMDTEQNQSNLVFKRYIEVKLILIQWLSRFKGSADQLMGVGFL